MRRLASSAISRPAIVLGKWGSRMALGLIQIAFTMVTASLLFHMQWGPHLPAIVFVLSAYAALAASLGILLGNFARTEGQVIGIGVVATNIMAALGGCWWPTEITPLWSQKLAILLPTGATMDALHKLISFGLDPSSVLPHVAALLAAALAAAWLVARSFRFQ